MLPLTLFLQVLYAANLFLQVLYATEGENRKSEELHSDISNQVSKKFIVLASQELHFYIRYRCITASGKTYGGTKEQALIRRHVSDQSLYFMCHLL